ncbi:MAG TPA: TetR/AcrR family transcriptional regulator [Casimicrobiaceae bacterium]|nr:TetR/AcrR family transcriptional regulator [Casimicrobiaceae bacterium]
MNVLVPGRRRPVRPDSLHVLRGRKTRRRILDAARARILGEGYENLRLDMLAQDAGVTKAAVVKSVGGKASILLALGDEDRQERVRVIREALGLRTALRKRLADAIRRMLMLDSARLNVVIPYIGHMWFWSGADHDRAQAMLDETRAHLRELVAAASRTRLSAAATDTIALRVMSGYALALRDLYYRRTPIEEAVNLVTGHALGEQ